MEKQTEMMVVQKNILSTVMLKNDKLSNGKCQIVSGNTRKVLGQKLIDQASCQLN